MQRDYKPTSLLHWVSVHINGLIDFTLTGYVRGLQDNGRRVLAVALGDLHSLALTDDGQIFSWGDNSKGQLGRKSDCYMPR